MLPRQAYHGTRAHCEPLSTPPHFQTETLPEKDAHCFRGGTGIVRIVVPWCGPSSTAIVHTEKLGVRSDAAPTSDSPGLFIGTTVTLAYFAKCRSMKILSLSL